MTAQNSPDDIKNRFLDLVGYSLGIVCIPCVRAIEKVDLGLQEERKALLDLNTHWTVFVLEHNTSVYGTLIIPSTTSSSTSLTLVDEIGKYITRVFPGSSEATNEECNDCVNKIQDIFPLISEKNMVGGVWRF